MSQKWYNNVNTSLCKCSVTSKWKIMLAMFLCRRARLAWRLLLALSSLKAERRGFWNFGRSRKGVVCENSVFENCWKNWNFLRRDHNNFLMGVNFISVSAFGWISPRTSTFSQINIFSPYRPEFSIYNLNVTCNCITIYCLYVPVTGHLTPCMSLVYLPGSNVCK